MSFGLGVHFDFRYLPYLLVTGILVAADLSFGILRGWESIALAIVSCLVTEVACARLYWGKWVNPASAYMSGISVGILIRSPMMWPFVLGGVLTILSKYVLRVKGKHIWNPSNFAICALFFLAPFAVAPLNTQWSNALWPMLGIWALGFYTLWKVGYLHVTVTYVIAFVTLSLVRSFITGDPFWAEVAPLTGPMYQLFALFMITDPKTTVSSWSGRVGVTVIIALVELFLRLGEVVYAPFYALFLVGPIAKLVEIGMPSGGVTALLRDDDHLGDVKQSKETDSLSHSPNPA